MMNDFQTPKTPDYAALIGVDWGDKSHAVAILDTASGKIRELKLPQVAEQVHQWVEDMFLRYGGAPVALAIEGTKGALINALIEVSWLEMFAVHTTTSSRFRLAFSPSGAKDDPSDARMLLDLLRHHPDKLRPIEWDDAQTRLVAALNETRRGMVDQRTQLTNELTSLLKSYFPQALKLVGDLRRPMALDFLAKWPDLLALKRSRAGTIRKFYYQHNVRSPKAVEERLQLLSEARALTVDETVLAASGSKLRYLLDLLRPLQKHITRIDQEIKEAFQAHPEASFYRNLPGAGAAMAPRLLAGFGNDRTRFPTAQSLLKYSGIAPVKEKSGSKVWIHRRWRNPHFLHQTFVEWAALTIKYCDWARACYQDLKARGKKHWIAVRALAFKWIRVLWRCWQDHRDYDDARYTAVLQARGVNTTPTPKS